MGGPNPLLRRLNPKHIVKSLILDMSSCRVIVCRVKFDCNCVFVLCEAYLL